MANNYNYLFKYIIIGDPAVGKSNILMKYAHNKFTEEYQATIGVEFGAKNIEFDDLVYRIQVWDTAGQENFRSITRAYYKNSVCAFVVYDITNRQSFESIQSWIEDIREQSPKTVSIVLIGNKNDLEEDRKVTFDEGKNFATENRLLFMETSAKLGTGIEEIFKKSAQEIAAKMEQGFYDLTSETCGIKKGNNDRVKLKDGRPSRLNAFEFQQGGVDIKGAGGNEKKSCC